jgi:hypothetical protein
MSGIRFALVWILPRRTNFYLIYTVMFECSQLSAPVEQATRGLFRAMAWDVSLNFFHETPEKPGEGSAVLRPIPF